MKKAEAFKILNSSEAYELFVKLGYGWGKPKRNNYLNEKYLFANKGWSFSWSSCDDVFLEKEARLITLDQLYYMVNGVNMVNKVNVEKDMNNLITGLITGEQALEALARGEGILHISKGMEHTGHWVDTEDTKNLTIHDFFSGQWSFKIK